MNKPQWIAYHEIRISFVAGNWRVMASGRIACAASEDIALRLLAVRMGVALWEGAE